MECFTKAKTKTERTFDTKSNLKKRWKLFVKCRGYNNSFNSWIDIYNIVLMSDCTPKPKSFGRRVNVQLELSNYATKVNLKTSTGVDTSKFAKNVDLANLKFDVYKLDIGKLKNVSTN